MCLANARKPDDSTTSTREEEEEAELVGAACIDVGALRAVSRVLHRRRTACTLPPFAVAAMARMSGKVCS